MINVLKEIILDAQREELFTGVGRRLEHETVRGKAFVCIGVRRCGKTTFLHQIMKRLEKEEGVPRRNVFYINFFDDRLTEIRAGNLNPVTEAAFTLSPELKGSGNACFFLDEIQEVRGWEAFVERLLRAEKCRVYVSGSSSKMLSTEIATQLRGRALAWELFPFSFREFLDFKKIDGRVIDSKARFAAQKGFAEYFRRGGFPEVLDKNEKIALLIHQEYYKSIMHRDVIERHDVGHPQAAVRIGYRLLTSVANLYTLNRLTEYVKSFGYKVPKSFVADCVQWLEDAFFLFSIQIHNASANVRNVNPKKIYCVDHGLVRSVSPDIQEKEGYLLENIVFVHLRTRVPEIHYYRTKSGNEIDFVWTGADGKKRLAQVCFRLGDKDTEKRETRALVEGMNELKINKAWLVTYGEEKEISLDRKKIHVIPAWRFLLQDPL